MTPNWIPATIRPVNDCEVFTLSEVVKDYYDYKKGEYIMQTDCYSVEDDTFLQADDDRLLLVCWREIRFPAPPEIYLEKTTVIIHTYSSV